MKKSLFVFLIMISGILISCSTKDMAINKEDLDTRVHPGTDFYQYANGGWMENNPLPDEYSRFGSFDKLANDNKKMVRGLIEEAAAKENAPGSIAEKVGNFYHTGMDTALLEKSGLDPVKDLLGRIDMVKNSDDLSQCIYDLHKKNLSMLFFLYGAPDKMNSEMVIANVYQGGLGLTDVDYYTAEDEKSEEIRAEYRNYISDMLQKANFGGPDPRMAAEQIFELEDKLARASMTRLERRNPHLTYNKKDVSEWDASNMNLSWRTYLNEVGLSEIKELNIAQPEFFSSLDNLLGAYPVEQWKLYLKWHILNEAAPYLSSAFEHRNFEFYGMYLSGKKAIQPRWKRVLQIQDYALGEAIGQMFVEKYFPPEAKERMLDLVSNLKLALGERIDLLEWMSDETKELAHAKLATMNVKIGYPDKWRDYSGLEVGTDSYYGNVLRAMEFNHDYRISKIGKKVDPDEWGMTPQTVNAYYSPPRNEIVFPAAILQPPFFYLDGDDAVNYGAIGVVIGHEMTHGFDDQGRKFDKDGNLKDWWTEGDAERFDERAKVLTDQFNAYTVLDDVKADGALTLGENIADLGGLNISYTALKKAWEKNPPDKETNGFTPVQRFFLAYSHVWAQNITDKEILRRTKEDVHSLGKLRVNGPLPNMKEFYEAFAIDEEAEMYIAEENRASIW